VGSRRILFAGLRSDVWPIRQKVTSMMVLAKPIDVVDLIVVALNDTATRLIAPLTRPNMLRQQLIRSLRKPARSAALNGSRAFTASAPRPAEVELTIGLCHPPLPATTSADSLCRWKEDLNRRYATSLTPLAAAETVLTPPEQLDPPSSRPAKRPEAPSRDTATTRS